MDPKYDDIEAMIIRLKKQLDYALSLLSESDLIDYQEYCDNELE